MYNRAILAGRLTADPTLRYTQSGHPVASFTLAIDRPFEENGEKKADFIPIVAWRKLAEVASQYLSKGSPVLIEGRIQVRSYETQNGKRKATEVIAENLRFLGQKPKQEEAAASAAGEAAPQDRPEDDAVPF